MGCVDARLPLASAPRRLGGTYDALQIFSLLSLQRPGVRDHRNPRRATCAGAARPADPDVPTPFVEFSSSSFVAPPSHIGEQHRFWDKRNAALFVAAAALNGADFAVTRANLQSGGQELNPVVRIFGRSSAGLAVNFIGETAGVSASATSSTKPATTNWNAWSRWSTSEVPPVP